MSLDAKFLRKLIDDTKGSEKNNPREYMVAAVALLYPVNPEPCDETPPLPRASASYQEALLVEKKSLDALSVELLQTAWEYLETAARNEEYPLHQGAALREQALLILRLLNQKPVPFTPTKSLIGAMTTLIGAGHFTAEFAEQLIQKAVEKGDMCAQLYSIRRLLQIVNEKCPANQLECFKSWLGSHPLYKMDLTRFSKNLRASLGDEREHFIQCRDNINYHFRSDTLLDLLNRPAMNAISEYLATYMPNICRIDREFNANWNEIKLIPVATKQKVGLQKHGKVTFSLDRSISQPLKVKRGEEAKRRRSDPTEPKADADGKRDKDPAKYIHNGKKNRTSEASPESSKRSRSPSPK